VWVVYYCISAPKSLTPPCVTLCPQDLIHAARAFDQDDNVGCIVITGSEKAFAAGADIKEMASKTYTETYTTNMFADWADITKIAKPVCTSLLSFLLYF
jgi:enoyl-CoA hydratase/carnithine racemase